MSPNGHDLAIRYLFEKYYRQSHSSSVTSSHWAAHGERPELNSDGDVVIQGKGGFGDFVGNDLGSWLRHLPYWGLVKQYSNKHIRSANLKAIGETVARRSKRIFLYDCARQVVVLETALRALNVASFSASGIRTIAVIGDGYGYLGNLIHAHDPNTRIIFVNLGKQLLFDLQISKNVHPNASVKIIQTADDLTEQDTFFFLEAENFSVLAQLNVDLYFNVASMQEMSKAVVDDYFRFIKASPMKTKLFYCCNRVEKKLPNGELIRFAEYPWGSSEALWEETNPEWYRTYPSRTPPFWRPFDGAFQVRLARFH